MKHLFLTSALLTARSWLRALLPKFSSETSICHYLGFGEQPVGSKEQDVVRRFNSLINLSPDINTLRKIHSNILVYGCGDNIFLGTKLLNCYAAFGCIIESRLVFSQIINNNLSLWNSILIGYFRTCHCTEVLRLYLDLKLRRIGMESSTLTFVIKSCTLLGSLETGRAIHADSFKYKLNFDNFVGSSLITLYFSWKLLDDAHQAFDDILKKDVVAYTTLITGYAKAEENRIGKAFIVAQEMLRDNLEPNRVTLVSLLQAASNLKAYKEGRAIHGYAVRRERTDIDEILDSSLMDMYLTCGFAENALFILQRARTQSVGSWNTMISGFIQFGEPYRALDLFYLMIERNIEPDMITLADVLIVCAELEYLLEASSIHGYIIRKNFHIDLVGHTALIDVYSKCDRLQIARRVFDCMDERDVISFNVMITGYINKGLFDQGMEIFEKMTQMGIKPNQATAIILLSTIANFSKVKLGECAHSYILKEGFESDTQVAHQLLHMYERCGHIHHARKVFDDIMDKDRASWTSIILCYVHCGLAEESLILFHLMRNAGFHPDSITVLGLLHAMSDLDFLKSVKEIHGYVYRAFEKMDVALVNSLVLTYARCGVLKYAQSLFDDSTGRDRSTWNTMISSYGMHGKCSQAIELFREMRRRGIHPDEMTFTSLLSACSHAGMVKDGIELFHTMSTEYLMIPSEEHCNCMIDMLARWGRLDDAYDLVKCISSRRNTNALVSLLSACRIHKNSELGNIISLQLLDLEPDNFSIYTMVSNLYAEAGKWSEVVRIREAAIRRGLRKVPGYSLVESIGPSQTPK